MSDRIITREHIRTALDIISGALPFGCQATEDFARWYDNEWVEVDGFTHSGVKMAAADILTQVIAQAMPLVDEHG